ncbi:MAG: hypothetical protein IRY85_12840, partial [Micromonosporaceae bacterium]|nr:hypothetical protein [Micromonosporaceae bacterium]
MTQTNRGNVGPPALPFEDDFADYYDDEPPTQPAAPAVLRAPTPVAGLTPLRPTPPPGPPPRTADVDSPFLGLFPGATAGQAPAAAAPAPAPAAPAPPTARPAPPASGPPARPV